ncbi:MAG: TIGR04255 family protein [Polyangiaceae bacterium]
MGGGAHEFATADHAWKLSLTNDFLALTTKSYSKWHDFSAKMREPRDALLATYAPAFFMRVGLRYRDRIDREGLGLAGIEWRELLRAEALGELADKAIGPQIEHVLRELLVRLTEDAGHVRIVHGLQSEGTKSTYIIDGDFFTEKQTDTKAVSDVLDAFNRRAGNLFRWYITPRLHGAMEPHDPPG